MYDSFDKPAVLYRVRDQLANPRIDQITYDPRYTTYRTAGGFEACKMMPGVGARCWVSAEDLFRTNEEATAEMTARLERRVEKARKALKSTTKRYKAWLEVHSG